MTNLLTRKIREQWEKTTNEHRSQNGKEPRPLVIVIEEAHKLLNREMANQTSFSIIAREMRKYFVTLLVVDQRPSQIYDEVMSQLGTRITGKLEDDDDLSAVLAGVSGKETLRSMLFTSATQRRGALARVGSAHADPGDGHGDMMTCSGRSYWGKIAKNARSMRC